MVTRLCMPIQSKRQQDVLRGIIDLYLRLRNDGYVVTQIHTPKSIQIEVVSSHRKPWIDGVPQDQSCTRSLPVINLSQMDELKLLFNG